MNNCNDKNILFSNNNIKEKKKNFIAFRPMFLTFICIILALLIVDFYFINEYLALTLLSIALISFLVFIFIKDYKIFAIIVVLCIISSCVFAFQISNALSSYIVESQTYTVEGRTDGVINDDGKTKKFLLYNCNIILDDKIVAENKIIQAYMPSSSSLECGEKITFTANLSNVYVFDENSIVSYNAYNSVNYTCYINTENILKREQTNLTLQENIKYHAYQNFINNMSNEGAGLAYAVLFGDKVFLEESVKTAFIESGLAHILAVSGLHTTLIFAIIIFLIGKLRIKFGYKALIAGSILLLFSYLCGFTPSVVRASIMAIVLFLAPYLKQKYDTLNTLGFAGVIILTLNPMQVFDISFILSFSCIFAIVMLFKLFNNEKFIPSNKKLRASIIMPLAISIGTLPCMAFSFGSISILSIIVNALLLPVFVFIYSFFFIVSVICLILPLGFLLTLVDYVFLSIIGVCKFFTMHDFAYVKILDIGILGMLACSLLIFASSQKFGTNKIIKTCTITILCFIIAISTLLHNIPSYPNGQMIRFVNEPAYIQCNNNKITFIQPFTSDDNLYKAAQYLSYSNIGIVDNIIMISEPLATQNGLQYFTSQLNLKNIYYPALLSEHVKAFFSNVKNLNFIEVEDGEKFIVNDIEYIIKHKYSMAFNLIFTYNNQQFEMLSYSYSKDLYKTN